jgi:hypothetical protein
MLLVVSLISFKAVQKLLKPLVLLPGLINVCLNSYICTVNSRYNELISATKCLLPLVFSITELRDIQGIPP